MSALEGSSLVRPPCEALSHVVRNSQKVVLKDFTTASATAKSLAAQLSKSSSASSLASAEKSVASLIATLTSLRRKLEETEKTAWKATKALASRIEFLAQMERMEGETSQRRHSITTTPHSTTRKEGERKGPGLKGDRGEEDEGGEVSMLLDDSNGHSNGHTNGVHATSPSYFPMSSIPSLTPSPTPTHRLHRIVFDYLLRSSYFKTAQALSTQFPHLAPLCDVDAFLSANRVMEGLRARDVSRALSWCGEYRSRLRSVGSSMEFQLRIQEMMELVKKGDRDKALEYAKKWLGVGVVQGRENGGRDDKEEEKEGVTSLAGERGQWEDPVVRVRMKELQEAITAVMFFSLYHPSPSSSSSSSPLLPPSLLPPTSAAYARYSHFWSDARWVELEQQFRLTHLAVHGLPPHSQLALTLYIGFATLKTPYCKCNKPSSSSAPAPAPASASSSASPTSSSASSTSSSSSSSASSSPLSSSPVLPSFLPSSFSPSAGCPLCCSPVLFELSQGLPSTQRSHSSLVCRLSGCVMDEHNPPCVLPNGSMYSRRALQRMAAENGGIVICIRTQEKFTLEECKPAFVL